MTNFISPNPMRATGLTFGFERVWVSLKSVLVGSVLFFFLCH